MAQRSFLGRAAGRAGERILAGSNNYNPVTGRYRNVQAGAMGMAARWLITAFAGPLAGQLAGRGINKLVDRYGPDPEFPQMEAVPIPGYTRPAFGTSPAAAPAPQVVSNLGFPSQSPGGMWAGYLQGQGSVNNFGNQNFTRPGGALTNWSPASTWGQGIQEGQGSNLNFGNYSPGATATGAVRGGGGGAVGVNSGARRGGGNSVGDAGGARSAFWRKAYEQN